MGNDSVDSAPSKKNDGSQDSDQTKFDLAEMLNEIEEDGFSEKELLSQEEIRGLVKRNKTQS